MQDFDDLMRSGDTMKVSLTPDRLRTMEVRLELISYMHPPTIFVGREAAAATTTITQCFSTGRKSCS
jgi:hypothetical protein